ncbi:hypothetical protein N658DRAFT_467526 [Parathielavia hyrcaniae]|uniref:Uncharacterized protein n=1 Tax=Parathielavia hyrcaniae TaxID=113614 RepID=A0AAN6Q3X7_9PEZI|nr:hypothetical protein N658DRAFT_467526 [Parathielavia hyrcaniae]
MVLVLLDFDGTITQHDTLSSLITLAIADNDNRTLTQLWADIVDDYVASHQRHAASYAGPPAERRRTLREELAYLESVRGVELRSVAREERGGINTSRVEGEEDGGNGSEGEEVKKGAVVVRRGLGEFLEQQASRGWDVAVVSVNWSGEFIRGVVEAVCEPGQGRETVMRMVANGIGFPDGCVEGPKELGGEPLVSAGDKLRAMKSLRRGWEEDNVVYFGDSTTDLACLVAADLGVVIADDGESKLLKTLKRLGFGVSHVGEARGESKLVWAKDFVEVLQSGVMDRI